MSAEFDLAIRQIRKDWSIPDRVVMLYSKNMLTPVGYQAYSPPAVNDNEAKK